jgi:hypothetical protein
MDREKVMIPTGWDSWKNIKAYREFDCEGLLDGWDDDVKREGINQADDSDSSVSAKKIYDEVVYHEDDDKVIYFEYLSHL